MSQEGEPDFLSTSAVDGYRDDDDDDDGGGESPAPASDDVLSFLGERCTNSSKWIFSKEKITNSPSRRCRIDADKELYYRQQSANFIQDMGQKLALTQLCINTAIVFMHRFYMYHSFSYFPRFNISTACIFLAAKTEEQPRKLEYVIKISHHCLYKETRHLDVKSEQYAELSADLIMNENILLQTLGFDVGVDHPHIQIVKCCQLVRASRDLAQASYFMATNSLHLTTMCLEYRPTVVASACINLACKWSNWQIPKSKEGKEWFTYLDSDLNKEEVERITSEFLHIFNRSPSKLKKKIMTLNQGPNNNISNNFDSQSTDKPSASASTSSTFNFSDVPSPAIFFNAQPQQQQPSFSSTTTTSTLFESKEPADCDIPIPNSNSINQSSVNKNIKIVANLHQQQQQQQQQQQHSLKMKSTSKLKSNHFHPYAESSSSHSHASTSSSTSRSNTNTSTSSLYTSPADFNFNFQPQSSSLSESSYSYNSNSNYSSNSFDQSLVLEANLNQNHTVYSDVHIVPGNHHSQQQQQQQPSSIDSTNYLSSSSYPTLQQYPSAIGNQPHQQHSNPNSFNHYQNNGYNNTSAQPLQHIREKISHQPPHVNGLLQYDISHSSHFQTQSNKIEKQKQQQQQQLTYTSNQY